MEIGQLVMWTSQAQGSFMEKKGTILAEIPAGERAKRFLPCGVKKSHIKFDKDISIITRVLVAVPAGKNGQITHYYCPAKHVLELQGVK